MYKRISIAFFTLIIIFGILITNLGIIFSGVGIYKTSQGKNTRSIEIAESRGMIYDRNMKKIVNNTTYNVTVALPTPNAANILKNNLTDEQFEAFYENLKNNKVTVLNSTKRIYENHVKMVSCVERYSDNQSCVHLIGHLNENGEGVMGLEKAYENYLRLQKGTLKAYWSVDAIGNILTGEGINFERDNYLTPAGIQLTVDLDIQRIAEESLTETGINKGAVVILNSYTNEILAMASAPEFDPDNVSLSMSNTDSPFINRCITPYSVGSVFKPIVAACALENNIDLTHNCTGSITINGTVFRCSNSKSHGFVDMNSAMEQSCNTYFIALGQKIGKEKLISLCNDSGFGKGIELADNFNTQSGILPTTDSVNSPQALANLSFGQGNLLVSPLQMAVAYSCFANGGYYRPPTLMKSIVDEKGQIVQEAEISPSYRILNKSTVEKLDEILENVVSSGNGKMAYSQTTVNHGKTATAQSGWYEGEREITHTWFCGYFSCNDTTYTVVVFKDDGYSGAVDCAPAFKFISDGIEELKEK